MNRILCRERRLPGDPGVHRENQWDWRVLRVSAGTPPHKRHGGRDGRYDQHHGDDEDHEMSMVRVGPLEDWRPPPERQEVFPLPDSDTPQVPARAIRRIGEARAVELGWTGTSSSRPSARVGPAKSRPRDRDSAVRRRRHTGPNSSTLTGSGGATASSIRSRSCRIGATDSMRPSQQWPIVEPPPTRCQPWPSFPSSV